MDFRYCIVVAVIEQALVPTLSHSYLLVGQDPIVSLRPARHELRRRGAADQINWEARRYGSAPNASVQKCSVPSHNEA